MKSIKRAYPVVSILLVLILSELLASCTQSNNPSNEQSGSITGVVTLGTELNGSSPRAYPSSAGVDVALDSTSFSTVTDSTGFWKFNNVPAGNYDVTISKAGFGLTRVYGVSIEGPGTAHIPSIDLGEAPATPPQLVSAQVATITWSDSGQQHQRQDLQIRWTTPFDRDICGLCMFIDKDSSVQPAGVHWYFSLDGGNGPWEGWFGRESYDTMAFSSSNNGLMACPVSALHAAGIPSGSTAYISLAQYDPYGINSSAPNNTITYYDPVHNQSRLISPSPRSNIIAVTIP